MSLNGLDTVQVSQIYESTIAEAGGWFLLHYITRDEVDVHKSGSGGLSEFKEAIEQYEEKSPLYGLLVYRRKRVLLKYVPEGTSRLLQARLTVHLQSVIEKFPHDALLSLESAAELTDTALSSSVSALKTSGSIRSLNSVKKRPLTEIAEDASEILISDSQLSTPIDTPTSDSHSLAPLSATREQFADSEDKESTSTTKGIRGLGDDIANDNNASQRPSTAIDTSDFERRPSLTPSDSVHSTGSKSLQSAPTPNSDSFAYGYKPKVKLAPRPVEESRHSNSYARPTSSLPAGVQIQSRERANVSPIMPPPSSVRVTNFPLSPTDRYANGSAQTPTSLSSPTYENRPISRGSFTAIPSNVRTNEEPTITPEKKRLMKALQKRKQQQKARQLAREGKFDDDDMVDSKESGYADESDNFTTLNSARSASPQKLDEILSVARVSRENRVSPENGDVTTDEPPKIEDTDLSAPDTLQPNSIVEADLLPQDELSPPADTNADRPRSSEFHTKDPVKSVNDSSDKLQHTLSLLQFPDWSDANNRDYDTSSQTAGVSVPASHSEHETASAEDDSLVERKIESYQPLVLNLPQESALGHMNLSINNGSRPQSPEDSAALNLKPTPPASAELQGTEVTPKGNEHVQNNTGAFHPEKDIIKATETTDPADQSLREQDSIVDVAHSMDHDTKDEIHISPHELPMEPENDPQTDTEVTPIHADEDDVASIARLTPWSDQQVYTAPSSDQIHPSVDQEEMQELHTSSHNQDIEIDSNTAIEPISVEDQPILPTISTIRDSASHSEAPSFSEEDSLLEELHSATVEEATSLKLPRTPPAPFSPTSPRQIEAQRDNSLSNVTDQRSPPALVFLQSEVSQQSPQSPQSLNASPISPLSASLSESPTRTITPDIHTSLSHPADQENASPNPPSFSTFLPVSRQGSLSAPPGELERPASRKSAVSSLISQRIKAFEDKFSAPSSPQQTPTSAVKAQIVTLRKVSLNTPSQQPQSSASTDRAVHSSYPTPSPSPHNFAQKLGFGKTTKRENSPKDAGRGDKTASETISILNKGVSDSPPITAVAPERPISSPEAKGMRAIFSSKSRKKKTNGNTSSSSIGTENRASIDVSPRGNSVSPHSNSSESIERTYAPSSTESLTSDGEKKDPKKRAGLLKRLSTMGSSNHRSIAETITAPVSEKAAVEPQASETARAWRSSVVLGELNVQFPDTLLWKRRHAEIDSQGFVVLTPSQVEKNSKAIMKRYHVSEFKMPYVPEPDREELPYSVNLDFLDGSTIQCACDGSTSQYRVYQALTAARNAFGTA